jgi:hypothetical protein
MLPLENTPLHRAQLRCQELEAELKKSPDFQLYLMTKARKDRQRMERLLLEIPEFKLWYLLTQTVRRGGRRRCAPVTIRLPLLVSST